MAVIVSGIEVIDNSRVLQNISGANGRYNAFHPNVTAIVTTLDMDKPFMSVTMNSNATYTELNKEAGKTAILILDTSSSGYTPTFSANVKWPADNEPTWANHRYWEVALVCWNNTIIRAAAIGFDA
jgi:hypothetical protein